MGGCKGAGQRDVFNGGRLLRQLTTACIAATLLAPPAQAQAQAQALNCFPPPIDTCGKGAVRGSTDGVAWVAWWVEHDFEWRRVHWYFVADGSAAPAATGVNANQEPTGVLSAANIANGTLRSCHVAPHRQALAACRALTVASDRTLPPAILYNVDRATAKDGARPGYGRTAIGALLTDGQRHRAGTWCECWRGAVKLGTTQYCLVTQSESYAACRRVQ